MMTLPLTVEIEAESSEGSGRSSCTSALPDFSWQGVSSSDDDGAARPADLDVEQSVDLGGATKRRRTEPEHAEEEATPAEPEDLLFDPFVFGDQLSFFNGGAYEPSLEGLFGVVGDAVQCGDGLGIWSFDDERLVDDAMCCY
ncbi:hypothetical protein EJB05_07809, partial [Eragrostis curvula]